jgi:hypothetical protein
MVYQLLSSVLPGGSDGAFAAGRESFSVKSQGKGGGQKRLTLKGAQKSTALSITKLFVVLILLLMLYTTFFGRGDFTVKILLWMSGFFLVVFTTWEHHYVLLLPVMVLLYLRTKNGLVLIIYFFLALPTPFIFYRSMTIESWLYFASKGLPALALFLMVLKENFKESADRKGVSSFLDR